MQKRKHIITVAFALTIVSTLVALALRGSQPEPTYDGHPLSYWVGLYYPVSDERDASAAAINHIGTNATPFLLRWVAYKPSFLRTKAEQLLVALPDRWIPKFITKPAERSRDAARAFEVVGPGATNAIPALTSLSTNSTTQELIENSTSALARIGPAALPALLQIVVVGNAAARSFALVAISDLGGKGAPALTVVIECLSDPEGDVSQSAAEALHDIEFPPQLSIPALTNLFASTNPKLRASAARGLASFGYAAQVAIPYLDNALQDAEESPRAEARRALERIPVDVVTNAPAQ